MHQQHPRWLQNCESSCRLFWFFGGCVEVTDVEGTLRSDITFENCAQARGSLGKRPSTTRRSFREIEKI